MRDETVADKPWSVFLSLFFPIFSAFRSTRPPKPDFTGFVIPIPKLSKVREREVSSEQCGAGARKCTKFLSIVARSSWSYFFSFQGLVLHGRSCRCLLRRFLCLALLLSFVESVSYAVFYLLERSSEARKEQEDFSKKKKKRNSSCLDLNNNNNNNNRWLLGPLTPAAAARSSPPRRQQLLLLLRPPGPPSNSPWHTAAAAAVLPAAPLPASSRFPRKYRRQKAGDAPSWSPLRTLPHSAPTPTSSRPSSS